MIMDGHSSHITADIIAFCIKHFIDLLILPPHSSHILQPLDISMFAPLKRALTYETDAHFRLNSERISRVKWTDIYIRAREKAFITQNILSGWKNTGLMPLNPITILEKLSLFTRSNETPPRTPP